MNESIGGYKAIYGPIDQMYGKIYGSIDQMGETVSGLDVPAAP